MFFEVENGMRVTVPEQVAAPFFPSNFQSKSEEGETCSSVYPSSAREERTLENPMAQ
jgi:hypothetical protein